MSIYQSFFIMYKESIKKIYLSRHILWDMALKQLKEKYAGSKLGIWWAIIIPLILAASINFIFTIVFKINIPNYTFLVLAGIIPWLFFSNALGEATNSFIINTSILKQGIFPREFIPISSILANFINFLIGLALLMPLFIVFNFKVIKYLIFLFPIVILHFMFIIGLGLLLSLVNVFFRDLSHFLSIAFMLWFWITPVFFSLDMIPFPYRWICLYNPMTYYVILYQNVLFQGVAPPTSVILIAFLISLGACFIGHIIFIKNEPGLLKRI